ncbi:MAG: hypothetical protein M3O86_00615 [Actinomycetota bacterium]|nr:hypothetical protein [Actinomycetota bacterium]
MRRLITAGVLLATAFATVPAAGETAACHGEAATQSGTLVYGSDHADVIVGTAGDDRLFAGGGDDTICGLGGHDVIDAGYGDDLVDGGAGRDTVWYSRYQEGVSIRVNLRSGDATGEGRDELVLGTVENVELNCSADNDDTLVGDDRRNVLSGGSGADRLVGKGGNDVLYGTDPSVDRTDAICWRFSGDRDVLDGGAGDDVLLGQINGDRLDGGAGFDVLDGGHATDACANGERYVGCETADPPAPPPVCGDGIDNDGDGAVDHPDDAECSSADDPTEDAADDPRCNDGRDNDHDGVVDFPADPGCRSLGDNNEQDGCIGPCDFDVVTIRYAAARDRFAGLVDTVGRRRCDTFRAVRVHRVRDGADPVVGRDTTDRDGRWRVTGVPDARGRFYAVAAKKVYRDSLGRERVCDPERSATIRVG